MTNPHNDFHPHAASAALNESTLNILRPRNRLLSAVDALYPQSIRYRRPSGRLRRAITLALFPTPLPAKPLIQVMR